MNSCVFIQHMDLDATVSISPITITKAAVSLDNLPIIRSALEGSHSLDSLMKPITIVDIVEISSSSVAESSQ